MSRPKSYRDLIVWQKAMAHQLMEQGTEVARIINGLLASLTHANPAHPAPNSASTAGTANPAIPAKAHAS